MEPEGKPDVTIKAINNYMRILRQAEIRIERETCDTGKQLYGENTFIGEHTTLSNEPETDEVWTTGITLHSLMLIYWPFLELKPG